MKNKSILYVVVCLALLAVSLGPVHAHAPWDKLGHFLAYGALALLAYRVASGERDYLLHCLALVVLGAMIELAQTWVPGRQGSALDLLANVAGVATAAVIAFYLFGRRALKR